MFVAKTAKTARIIKSGVTRNSH